jgi:tRNA pseudouridine55 synthase
VTNGVLVVDKPAGMTSHDVVGAIRRGLRTMPGAGQRGRGKRSQPKVGHAGTLDPMATGVLVVGVGKATRLVPWLQASTKTYEARLRLGSTTSTLDAEGEVLTVTDASHIDEEAVCEAFKRFVGEIVQIPPMVSAVRVDGERLYDRARRGEEVERPERRVTVHDLVLEDFVPGPAGEASFLLTCSTGTYVRTIADDVGRELGVGAHLVALRRLASGRFTADAAASLDEVVTAISAGELDRHLLSMAEALADYPVLKLSEADARALGHGRTVGASGFSGPVVAVDPDGDLVAMVQDEDGAARPLAVFKTTDSSE